MNHHPRTFPNQSGSINFVNWCTKEILFEEEVYTDEGLVGQLGMEISGVINRFLLATFDAVGVYSCKDVASWA